jgi:hypothetical protein
LVYPSKQNTNTLIKKNTMLKKQLLSITSALLLASSSFAQSARVQVIHNCADAAAATVDVWINDSLLIDDFNFRTASPFIDAPSGVAFDITVQPSNSIDTTNGLARFTYNLMAGETYVLIANGTVSGTGYSPVQPFNIDVFVGGEEASGNPANTNILVYHGATDAPTVDIVDGASTLVDDISYAEFDASYLQLPTADYQISVTDATGANTVATYSAPLAALSLQGVSLVAVASGFLNPANNSNGPDFGIWVALPLGGNLIQLPLVNTNPARVQVIHNCADAAAATVDIWINDSLLIDDFDFRTASPFIDAPSGVAFDITVQPSTSIDTTNALARFTYTLMAGETYVLIANGTVSGSGYSPVQPFNIDVFAGAEEASGNPANTNILVYHGTTDAPTVDIVAGASTLVDDISYAEFDASYLQLPTADYQISVTDATGANTVATYSAPLAALSLQGLSLVAVASGFLNPANNSNGADFGIWVALPLGGNLIPLPLVNTNPARVQVIHNCADAAAATVDIWINDSLLINNFNFRTASPFIDAPSGVAFDITVQPSTSIDTTNGLARFTYTLMAGETYVLIANGTVSGSGYSPVQPFNLDVFAGGEEASGNPANTNILVYHGATDAPTVDIVAGASTLVDDISYAEFDASYLQLPTADYEISVTDASGANIVATYSAPLANLNLQGASLVAVASGFLNPANNSNGPDFGIWVSLPIGGNLIPLPVVTSIENAVNNGNLNIYPNPASDKLMISNLVSSENSIVNIYNNIGALVLTQQIQQNSSAVNTIEIENLSNGLYTIEVIGKQTKSTSKLSIAK